MRRPGTPLLLLLFVTIFLLLIGACTQASPTTVPTEAPAPASAQAEATSEPAPSPAPTLERPLALEPTRAPTPAAAPEPVELVAFAQDGRIGVATLDGSQTSLLSAGPSDFNPVWSPDGGMVAFTRLYPVGAKGTYVMRADGTGLLRVAPAASISVPPTWSPDGRRLAISDHAAGRAGLWTVNVDGTDLTQLFESGRPLQHVAWSPDGETIAFTFNLRPTSGGLYLVSAAGGEPVLVMDVPEGGLYRAGAIAWSPDARYIAVRSNPKPPKVGEPQPDPPVSPILSLLRVEDDGEVALVHRLSEMVEGDWQPAWAPNGHTVAFLKQGPGGRHQLAVASLETGETTVLAERNRLGSPGWSPDGGQLLVSFYTPEAPQGALLRMTLADIGMDWTMDMDMTADMKVAAVEMLAPGEQAAWAPALRPAGIPSSTESGAVVPSNLRRADVTFTGLT